jgi:hypothetical protein
MLHIHLGPSQSANQYMCPNIMPINICALTSCQQRLSGPAHVVRAGFLSMHATSIRSIQLLELAPFLHHAGILTTASAGPCIAACRGLPPRSGRRACRHAGSFRQPTHACRSRCARSCAPCLCSSARMRRPWHAGRRRRCGDLIEGRMSAPALRHGRLEGLLLQGSCVCGISTPAVEARLRGHGLGLRANSQ